jgi:hypothetical protein
MKDGHKRADYLKLSSLHRELLEKGEMITPIWQRACFMVPPTEIGRWMQRFQSLKLMPLIEGHQAIDEKWPVYPTDSVTGITVTAEDFEYTGMSRILYADLPKGLELAFGFGENTLDDPYSLVVRTQVRGSNPPVIVRSVYQKKYADIGYEGHSRRKVEPTPEIVLRLYDFLAPVRLLQQVR